MAENLDETIIIARGNITSQVQAAATKLLGSLGLSTEIVDMADYKKFREENRAQFSNLYSFEEITSREQWVTKEHVMAFRAGYAGDITERMATRAFGTLVLPDTWERRKYGGAITPNDLGLIVKPREEVGLPLYESASPTSMDALKRANMAIQAGSLIDFMASFPPTNRPLLDSLPKFGPNQEFFMRRMATFLDIQISSNTARSTE